MCGIASIIKLQTGQITSKNILEMGHLLKHRGPDDEGYAFFVQKESIWEPHVYSGPDTQEDNSKTNSNIKGQLEHDTILNFDPKIVFCHRRLSIIDLSPLGHQPMQYNERYWITYNGEIYNYLEIKKELEKKGYQFATQSDTEIILASYAEWGHNCLHKFVGMWAFLIFDTKTGVIFGSRDRFGIKPLYYWFSPEGYLSFASEIKAFTRLPGWAPTVNGQRAYDFLIHGISDHTEETLFKGVLQIKGGEYFQICVTDIKTSIPIKKWYNIPSVKQSGNIKEKSVLLLKKLRESINIHLRSDVPIGSCLSGGLDSSTIVSIIYEDGQNNNKLNNKQNTFSACSYQKQWDEREYIEEVLKNKNINSHYVYPEIKELFEKVQLILWHQDEPFGSTSIFAQWVVFQSAKDNEIKVILDGQGADEIIGGYHYFHNILIASLFLRVKFLKMIRELIAIHNKHKINYWIIIKNSAYYILCNNAIGRKFLEVKEKEHLSPNWLDMEMMDAKVQMPLLLPKTNKHLELFTRYCYHQTFEASLPALLHYEDRNSMAHSIESRVPFLDHRLVEYIMNLLSEDKIHNGITKCIIRMSTRGILPDKIRLRMDKLGFATPEEYWIKKESTEQFRRALNRSIQHSQGILNENALIYFDNMVNEKEGFSFIIWRMIIFGEWMNYFKVKP